MLEKTQNYFSKIKKDFAKRRIEKKVERKEETFVGKKNGILAWSDYRHPAAWVAYGIGISILIIFVFLALAPIFWLFVSAFKSTSELYEIPYDFWPQNFSLMKIVEVWQYLNFGKYFLNSVIVAVGSVAAAIFFNGLLAYAVSVVKPRGYKIVYALVMLSFMIPAVANLVPLFKEIADFGLIDSYLPLCLAAGANTFYFLLFKTYFDSLPQDLFEAARVDGAGDLRIFFSIIVPLSRPIIGVVSIFAMTAAWSDFLLPYLVLQDDAMKTIMVKIYSIQSTIATSTEFGPDRLLMLLCLSIIPQIIFFAIFQKQITATSTTSGIKE
jgi:multiple sugar transport system permease protein